jgi:uncharacterized protein (TIGR04255 family)
MSTGRPSHLPDFLSPPVIETVLAASFPALALQIPHFGLLWAAFRAEYPKCEVHPPISLEPEKYGAPEIVKEVPSVTVLQEPPVRCWFVSQSGNHVVQVQQDAFLHNWRKTAMDEPYPHYEHICPAFQRDWERFLQFLSEEKLPRPQVAQCEVTYVNHIEKAADWQSFSNLSTLFPLWCGQKYSFLPEPDAVSFNVRFSMPENRGRLRVAMRPAIRISDGQPIFELKLTARGAPSSSETEAMMSWFDLGREWIVRGFGEITSPTAHKYWKRTQ